MLTKIGLAFAIFALVMASWTYRTALADATGPLPSSKQIACAKENCIGTLTHCRSRYAIDWHESLYTAAKAPSMSPRSCVDRPDLAMGE